MICVSGAGLAAGVLLLSGCSDAQLDAAIRDVFEPQRTAQQQMIIAVSDADADVRREAIANVAESKSNEAEWAIKGYIAIATLERDEQTRCVALRALGSVRDPRAVETCLRVLNWRQQPPAEIRPPGDLARWDAAEALAKLARAGVVSDEQREAARETLVRVLERDRSRHARQAAAEGLQYFPDRAVVEALIEGLRDQAFAVVHQCERSLAALTGETFGCDVFAWRDWYDANSERVFANAGHVPDAFKPRYTNRWGKFAYDTRQFFWWLFPGDKE